MAESYTMQVSTIDESRDNDTYILFMLYIEKITWLILYPTPYQSDTPISASRVLEKAVPPSSEGPPC